MENKRIEIKVNKVVDFVDGEIIVLDGFFHYADGFMGATGSKFNPISKSEYKERTKKANVKEHIRSCFDAEYILDNFGSLEKAYKQLKEVDEVEQFIFDTSYSYLWDYLREELKLSEKESFIFECIGGGRCFDKDFQGNINPELSEYIRKFENESVSVDEIAELEKLFKN